MVLRLVFFWGEGWLFQEKNDKFIFAGRDMNKTHSVTAESVSAVNRACGIVASAFLVLSLVVSFL